MPIEPTFFLFGYCGTLWILFLYTYHKKQRMNATHDFQRLKQFDDKAYLESLPHNRDEESGEP